MDQQQHQQLKTRHIHKIFTSVQSASILHLSKTRRDEEKTAAAAAAAATTTTTYSKLSIDRLS